jgi:hypothetical protein
MAHASIAETIRECVDRLPNADQHRVLEYAKSLAPLKGVPGRSLLRFAGTIDLADLEIMKQAIEEGCEKVDPNEW